LINFFKENIKKKKKQKILGKFGVHSSYCWKALDEGDFLEGIS
jgi:hypothetical protein